MYSVLYQDYNVCLFHIPSTYSYSDIVEARLGQARLGSARLCQEHLGTFIFLLRKRLDASRHFLANFLVISDHIWHKNFTDCFGGRGFALDLKNGLETLSKPLLYLSHQAPYTRTRNTKASSKEEPRHLWVYITVFIRITVSSQLLDFEISC